MYLTLNERQPRFTEEDIGTEFVRTGPAGEGDWSWVPSRGTEFSVIGALDNGKLGWITHKTSTSGIELNSAKLECITSTHLRFSAQLYPGAGQNSGPTVFELDKGLYDDGCWITAKKCEELFQKQPELFEEVDPLMVRRKGSGCVLV